MAFINLDSVSLDIPVFNANNRSLKTKILGAAKNIKLDTNEQGQVSVKVLKHLDLSFTDGDRVGLVGHNGAGKSSLLRLLGGVYYPTKGTITVKGETASLIDISLGIDQEATGIENIYLRGALLGIDRQDMESKLDEIVTFSELGDFIHMPLRTYSSGMHMRLAFSISTIIRPEILLLDEWLSVGDEKFKNKSENRMNELVNATKIMVIASHSRELILNTCNRVLWMENGQVRMDANPEEVCSIYFG